MIGKRSTLIFKIPLISEIPFGASCFSYISHLFLISFENIFIHFTTVLGIRPKLGLDEVFYSL